MVSKKYVLLITFVLLLILVAGGAIWLQRSKLFSSASTPNGDEHLHRLIQGLNKEIIDLNDVKINNSNKKQITSRIVNKAKIRKAQMLTLLQKSPEQFLSLAAPSNLRESLPDDSKQYIEQKVSIEGDLEIKVFDNFEKKLSKEEYYLTDMNGKKYQLFLSKDKLIFLPQTKVKISGVMVDDKIAVVSDNSQSFSDPAIQSKIPSPLSVAGESSISGVKKVAVLLINFQENGALQPFTPAYVQEKMFTGSWSVNKYYQAVSFDKLKFVGNLNADGDVLGWYTVSNPRMGCDYGSYAYSARIEAASVGIDLTVYDNLVYFFDNINCGWDGITLMGGKHAWVSNTQSRWPYFIAHELGHNFWMGHATYNLCVDNNRYAVPFGTPNANCQNVEYGDPFDIMGNPFLATLYHINNYYKGSAGWLESNNIQEIVDRKSGTYTVSPIETASTNVQALKIPQRISPLTGKPERYYILEYRQRAPFDSFRTTDPVVNGVTIRIAPVPGVYSLVSQLINTTYNGDAWKAPLLSGQTFVDPTNNITIKTTGIAPDKATTEVVFGPEPCMKSIPTVKVNPMIGPAVKPGTPVSYTIGVTNNNSKACSPATYHFYTQYIFSPWQLTYLPADLTITSGSTVLSELTVTSPTTTANGSTFGKVCVNNPDPNNTSCSDSFSYWVDKVNGDTTAPVGSIIINNNAPKTYTPSVSLQIDASDSGSDVYRMRISNNNANWTSWGPYQTTYNWNISSSNYGGNVESGVKTVYIQFEDRAHNISNSYSDSIEATLPIAI